MAIVKKNISQAHVVAADSAKQSTVSVRDAEAQRKKARTLAKQQQAAERIAAATGQLASGINEAASAAEELKRASDQIATGAEEASGAAHESLTAFKQVGDAVARQVQNAEEGQKKMDATQSLVMKTSDEIMGLVNNVGIAAQRQSTSVEMVVELENRRPTLAISSKP